MQAGNYRKRKQEKKIPYSMQVSKQHNLKRFKVFLPVRQKDILLGIKVFSWAENSNLTVVIKLPWQEITLLAAARL